MQREKTPEWREKQKSSRGIRRGQRYRLVFQFPIRERIAMLWLSEISHHFRGDSYCYGGGYYRRGHAQHALVFTPENQKITETNLKTVDDSSIDYTLPLAGEYPVSSAVVLCFRTQIFVTRSDVVLVSGIQRGEPEIVGRYDSLGNPLEA